jgi:uncharacterized membrane protein YfcA
MIHDLILLGAGFIVGVMNAIAGGGMLIGFPIMLSIGIPALTANASANVAVLPGNISAVINYRKYLKKVPKQYLFLLIPVIFGSIVGAILLRHTSFKNFNTYIPWLLLFAVGIFIFQPFLYQLVHKHLHGPKKFRAKLKPLLIIGVAIFPVSIYGGYFGAGFGFVMLAFLGFTKLHDHMHRITALKTLLACSVSGVSIICLLSSGLINWRIGLIMGVGNLFGGTCGARIATRVSSKALRIVIVIIGVGSAIYLVLRQY